MKLKAKGLTLTEVMLALSIVSMILVAIIGLGIQSLQFTEVAKSKSTASAIAQQGIEIIRSGVGYCQVDPCSYEVTDSDSATFQKISGCPSGSGSFRAVSGQPNYERSIEVRKITASETNLIENEPEKYSLVTVIVRNTNQNPRKQVTITARAILPPPRI